MIVANFVAAGAAVDLLELTRALVDVESVSYAEGGLADRIEADLRALPHLSVTRVGDNVVARTVGDRSTRLILAGSGNRHQEAFVQEFERLEAAVAVQTGAATLPPNPPA